VEDHFCKDKFYLSATYLTRSDERGAFTPQEFYRLKKILCDLRKVLLLEDEEKRARGRIANSSGQRSFSSTDDFLFQDWCCS